MKLAPLIPLRPPKMILSLARAKLAEVLRRPWRHVREEFHLDAAERFAAQSHVEEADWIWAAGDCHCEVYLSWVG